VARWREPCSAKRRDGNRCQAPAIPGGFVCRHHGGSALQVRAAAQLRLLQDAVTNALLVWDESRSTEDLYAIAAAENEVRCYLAELDAQRELRRSKRRATAAGRPAVELPPRNSDGTFRRRMPVQAHPAPAAVVDPIAAGLAEALAGPAAPGRGTTRPSPFA
jgi:hypothetical protein